MTLKNTTIQQIKHYFFRSKTKSRRISQLVYLVGCYSNISPLIRGFTRNLAYFIWAQLTNAKLKICVGAMLISNDKCICWPPHWSRNVQTFLMKQFLTDGLIVVDQSPGPHAPHPSILSHGRI